MIYDISQPVKVQCRLYEVEFTVYGYKAALLKKKAARVSRDLLLGHLS